MKPPRLPARAALILVALIGHGASAQAAALPACEALMRLRAIEGPLLRATAGDAPSFARLRQRMDELNQSLGARELRGVLPASTRIAAHTARIQQHQETVMQAHKALDDIRRKSLELLEPAEKAFTNELVDGSLPARVAAASQLVMLTQRLGRSAAELSGGEPLSPEAVFLFGKDTNSFADLTAGLLEGNAALRLRAAKPGAARQQLTELARQSGELRAQVQAVLSNLKALVEVREARAIALADSAALERSLDEQCTRAGGGVTAQ